ncbi:hypothetical protein GCM10010990_32320 [Croceicoccus mobilis]|uniref:Uncharacterized protein n=1 Tax=Croceicoccus mobilis TaxID=1703339 RepID=A0A916Z7A2_9SPHN|nr:hypothetical protein GCM10010990_32320 [Croceicoccus mobilis]
MGTNRRIDSTPPVETLFSHDLGVKRLAHPMETLEFILPSLIAVRSGHMIDRRQRLGIMGGKLRVDRIGCRQ